MPLETVRSTCTVAHAPAIWWIAKDTVLTRALLESTLSSGDVGRHFALRAVAYEVLRGRPFVGSTAVESLGYSHRERFRVGVGTHPIAIAAVVPLANHSTSDPARALSPMRGNCGACVGQPRDIGRRGLRSEWPGIVPVWVKVSIGGVSPLNESQ